jgi:hypothetical protein
VQLVVNHRLLDPQLLNLKAFTVVTNRWCYSSHCVTCFDFSYACLRFCVLCWVIMPQRLRFMGRLKEAGNMIHLDIPNLTEIQFGRYVSQECLV